MSLWNFVQDQLLGMAWLNDLIGRGLDKVGVDTTSPIGGSLHFFLYDVIKITVLLCLLIFWSPICKAIFRRREAGRSWAGSGEWGPIWWRPSWER